MVAGEHSLQRLGLSARLERTYLAMLDSPALSVPELAGRLFLDDAELRRQLEVLVIAGLVAPTTTPDSYQALPPDQAVEVLIRRAQVTINERRTGIESAREAIPQLIDTFVAARTGRTPGEVELLDDPSVVRARSFQLTRLATRRAQFVIANTVVDAQAVESPRGLDLDLLDRHIDVQVIASSVAITKRAWADHLREVERRGGEVRVHPAPPLSVILLDDTVCVLTRTSRPGALVTHHSDLSAPAVSLFETLWHSAEPATTPSPASLTPRHREALNLLAQGLTDDMIARRMQISHRSVGRLVAQLCEELQAPSRFAAGYLAARRGWLN